MSAKALAWIAIVVLGAGLVAGFSPVTSQGQNCGSAFIADDDAEIYDMILGAAGQIRDAAASCEDLRSILRIPALILIGAGVITVITSAEVARRGPTPTRREPEPTSEV